MNITELADWAQVISVPLGIGVLAVYCKQARLLSNQTELLSEQLKQSKESSEKQLTLLIHS
jgi:hypothetical protein